MQTKIVPSKAVVGVDRPMKAPSMHIQKPIRVKLSKEDLSFDKKISVESVQTKIVPSKAVVGVDRPMKAPSMHIQKPNKGKIV